jgi:hypothetical protein
MMGRPSDYTPEVAAEICERIVHGESLRAICRDEHMPAASTVFLWLKTHAEFTEQYARAREWQADTLADETLAIADNAAGDPARDRLRFDARRWYAGKVAPKKYGDKVVHAGDPEAPVRHAVEIHIVDHRPDQG